MGEAEPEGGMGLEGEKTLSWLLSSWRDAGMSPIAPAIAVTLGGGNTSASSGWEPCKVAIIS